MVLENYYEVYLILFILVMNIFKDGYVVDYFSFIDND